MRLQVLDVQHLKSTELYISTNFKGEYGISMAMVRSSNKHIHLQFMSLIKKFKPVQEHH